MGNGVPTERLSDAGTRKGKRVIQLRHRYSTISWSAMKRTLEIWVVRLSPSLI